MRQVPIVLILVAASFFCDPARAFPEDGRRLAFLVAVTEYSHAGLDPLEFTERDIDEMAKRLGEVGFDDVVSLTPQRGKTDPKWKPISENVRKRLSEFLLDRKVNRNDLVVVGLSGHGLQPRGSGDSFFCPADANPTMTESDQGRKQTPRFPQSLVSVGELLTLLDESGVGHKLLLVDACRNEPKSKGAKATGGIDRVNLGELPAQTGVLLSCSRGESSFENKQFGGGHGAFFYSVIEGLGGKARDGDGRVTWDSLAAYVRKTVPAAVGRLNVADGVKQRPNLITNFEGEPPVLSNLTSVAASNNDLPNEESKTNHTSKLEKRARTFIGDLAAGEFDRARSGFSPALLKLLPTDKLRGAWQSSTANLGEFDGVSDLQSNQVAHGARKLDVVIATCSFDTRVFDVRLVFDSEGAMDGVWLSGARLPFVGRESLYAGLLKVGTREFRLVVHFGKTRNGDYAATFDSPEQDSYGIPFEAVDVKGDKVVLKSTSLGADFHGNLSKNRQQLDGKWHQGNQTIPLSLKLADR